MRSAAVLVGVAAIALAGTGRGHGQQTTDPALNALADSFAQAFNAKNAAKVASYYAEDATLMPPDQPMVTGRRNIEAYYARGFQQDVADFRLFPLESAIAGAQAFEAGRSRLTVRRADRSRFGPDPIAENGKYVVIYKRVNGEWKIAFDIFNDD